MNKDEVVNKIITARVSLLFKQPFFGNIATRMRVIDASDWCKTAATDFRNLYYNRDWFLKMDLKEIEFVIAHEIYHCIFDHFSRREHRDPKLYNIAADYCVNGLLIRDKIGEMPKSIPGYYDKEYEGMSSERIYDLLIEKYDPEQLQKMGQLLDEHLGENSSSSSESGGRPNYTKEELAQIRDEVRDAMIQAAQATKHGQLPAEISRMVRELTESKINWRELIRQQIQSLIRSDYSFMRPNRKSWHTGAILPGSNFDTTIDVCLSLDMSGSISDEQALDMLTEVKGIVDEFKDFKLKIWCFDTKVYNEADYDETNGDDIDQYRIAGGGGTDLMCNWEYMVEHNIVPKKFIMFTDFYCDYNRIGIEDYCDTVFIIHSNPQCVPPWGEYAHYEPQRS